MLNFNIKTRSLQRVFIFLFFRSMGLVLYIISTRLYFFGISISTLFSTKARLFKNGRKNLFSRLKHDVLKAPGPYFWFHCASLGEFEQGRPVIEAFKKNFPGYRILLTFFSPSGFEVRKNYEHADLIYYLPEDTAAHAARFLDIVQPKIALFVKYEYWYFFLREIQFRKIPLLSISAVFRQEQLFFKPYGKFYRSMLDNFHIFFVQDENSRQLLQRINVSNVIVSGDTRFDRVFEIANTVKPVQGIIPFKNQNKVLVAGSIWKEDLKVLLPLVQAFPEIKFIIVPHEIDEPEIAAIAKALPNSSRYSKGINENQQILIIDNIGMLVSLYQVADYAFIGGGYGKGLHNILEAATFGVPVFFGNKNYKKFVEAVNLVSKGGAFPVADFEELKGMVQKLEQNPQKYQAIRRINETFIEENRGSTDKIVEYTIKLMKEDARKGH